jgi:hypothetical protein
MSDLISGVDNMSVTEAKSGGNDAGRIAEVKAWLTSQFDAAGKDVPEFEYTPRSIAHLYNLAAASQAKTQAANIVANDFRQKAVEYRAQGLVFGLCCLCAFGLAYWVYVFLCWVLILMCMKYDCLRMMTID